MKLILKEYLASLRERGELDKSVLPNLLSELGLRVLNTPMIGTRQNGVDIAAVGKVPGKDKKRHLYLFCVKAGNISRRDWASGMQAVRPELEEIRDVYLRSNVAQEYESLPVKICLCFGGELEETVSTNWAGYTAENTTDKISYEEWNGDRLAELMMKCLLARELLKDDARRNFQKAVAMVNEPNACYEYSSAFLRSLMLEPKGSKKTQLLHLRQSYICLHAVIAWANEADNLESTYKLSELGMLLCWNTIRARDVKGRPTKHDKTLMFIFDQFLKLYITTSERYFRKTAYAHSETPHALSMAVRSRESVDVNLFMFELLGRLAIHGIWTDFLSRSLGEDSADFRGLVDASTDRILDTIVAVVNNNPTLRSPIRDDHMIEVALVMYLAQLKQQESRVYPWLEAIAHRTTFALITNSQYPTCLRDYADLLYHPESAEQSYIDEACVGSILYPYLYMWMQYADKDDELARFVGRLKETIPGCTYQAWFPGEDTDELIWSGGTNHGICVTDLSPLNGRKAFEEVLSEAIEACNAIRNISAIEAGLIPMFLSACRHYRLPIPPNFWIIRI